MFFKALASFLFIFLTVNLAVICPAQTWTVSKAASKIEFKIKNAGMNVDGHFSDYELSIHFNPKDLSNASIKGIITAKSIRTGIKLRDNHLNGEDYFHTEKYGQITFTSKKIEVKTDGTYLLTGNLQIKNTSKEISIPFTFEEEGSNGTFKGSITINRRDYGVGKSSWTLADNAIITLLVTATKTH